MFSQGRENAGRESQSDLEVGTGRIGPRRRHYGAEKLTVVSITMFGKYRVTRPLIASTCLQRIHTWVPDPVLGDMNLRAEFTNATYADLATHQIPTVWHHHDGWDDNYGGQNVSAGHNGFGGVFKDVKANACPRLSRSRKRFAKPPSRFVWRRRNLRRRLSLRRASHNSVASSSRTTSPWSKRPSMKSEFGGIEEIVKLIPTSRFGSW